MNNRTSKPNVLWIMGDEFRTDALSCYGTPFPQIETPNIDRIARSGVRFTNCFCNSPICVPSRTSEMTATPPELNGVYGNEGSWASFPYSADFITFPEHFARNGYRTRNFGKTHLPVAMKPWQTDDHTGADLKTFYDGTDAERRTDEVYTPTLKAAIGGTFAGPVEFPGEKVTRNAVNWLSSAEAISSPFLARVSYLQPHSPVVPPENYVGLYADLPWPDQWEPPAETGSAFEKRFADVLQTGALDQHERKRVRSDYYALVKWLDDQVGLILDALEKSGLADNTIIVLEADHGVSLGEQGRLQKHTFAPEVHRIPRLIAWPSRLPQGQVRADLAQSLDLARTLCGLCGIEPAGTFHGRDLFGSEPPPDQMFATVGFGERDSRALPNQVVGSWGDETGWPRRSCIRTARYRLDMTVRRNGQRVARSEEDIFLADAAIDPFERVNRAQDPSYAQIVEQLRASLLEHIAAAREAVAVPTYSDEERGIN